VHLNKGRFPQGKFVKLKPKANDSFKVLKWIGENTYKIDLPAHQDILDKFNVTNLAPYYGDDNTYDLKMSLFQLGKHDTGVSPNSSIDVELLEFRLTM
jgi:hypothetical protein